MHILQWVYKYVYFPIHFSNTVEDQSLSITSYEGSFITISPPLPFEPLAIPLALPLVYMDFKTSTYNNLDPNYLHLSRRLLQSSCFPSFALLYSRSMFYKQSSKCVN